MDCKAFYKAVFRIWSFYHDVFVRCYPLFAWFLLCLFMWILSEIIVVLCGFMIWNLSEICYDRTYYFIWLTCNRFTMVLFLYYCGIIAVWFFMIIVWFFVSCFLFIITFLIDILINIIVCNALYYKDYKLCMVDLV